MKRLFLFLLLGAGIVAAFAAYLVLSLDGRVAAAIEESGSRVAGTPVTVEAVDIALSQGTGKIYGLRVANPEGFSTGDAIHLAEIELTIDSDALGAQPFRVSQVRVGEATVRFEVTDRGESNIDRLVSALAKPSEEPEEDGVRSEGEPQRIAIESLHFEGGEILLQRAGKDRAERVNLPALEMADIGGEQGATGGEIGRRVGRVFLRRVLAATAGHEVGRAVGKELGEAAGEVAESLLRRILD